MTLQHNVSGCESPCDSIQVSPARVAHGLELTSSYPCPEENNEVTCNTRKGSSLPIYNSSSEENDSPTEIAVNELALTPLKLGQCPALEHCYARWIRIKSGSAHELSHHLKSSPLAGVFV